jgi:cell wall-associated NlpC family hydrolase
VIAAAETLLASKNVVLDADGAGDLRADRIDPRVLAVLEHLSRDHAIVVSSLRSGHPRFTTNGTVSSHHHGRGADIAAFDGAPVGATNLAARAVAASLQDLDPAIRPDEIGTPWAIAGPGYFTDAHHEDHVHIGFKAANADGWTPPDVEPSATLAFAVPSARVNAARRARPHGAGAKALAALAEAKRHLGAPYEPGGSTPDSGFDCSGLTQWSYAQAGIEIPRASHQQLLSASGTPVDRDELLPGDLLFFRDVGGFVHHVGISLGGERFVHAPRAGAVVQISSLTEGEHARQFAGGRRFDPPDAAAPPDRAAVAAANARLARDASEVRRADSLLFAAVKAQEGAKAKTPPETGHPTAAQAGIPPELPAMAPLAEAGVTVPEFIEGALAVKRRRIAGGDVDFGRDRADWGEWIALSLPKGSA